MGGMIAAWLQLAQVIYVQLRSPRKCDYTRSLYPGCNRAVHVGQCPQCQYVARLLKPERSGGVTFYIPQLAHVTRATHCLWKHVLETVPTPLQQHILCLKNAQNMHRTITSAHICHLQCMSNTTRWVTKQPRA